MIETYILSAILFIFPFVTSSVFFDKFLPSKILILLLGALLIAMVKIFRLMIKNEVNIITNKTSISFFLFALVAITSHFYSRSNSLDTFFYPGAGLLIILSAIYYQSILGITTKGRSVIKETLIASGLFLSFATLFFTFSLFNYLPQFPEHAKNVGFSTLGGILPNFIYLATILPISFLSFLKSKEIDKKIYYMLASFSIAMAMSISAYNLLPGKDTSLTIVPLSISWSVTIDTIKNSPVLGAGPGNYIYAFTRHIPIEYNSLDLYQKRFPVSSSFYLNILSEVGILGFIVFLIAIYMSIIKIDIKNVSGIKISSILILILMLLLPVSYIFLPFFFVIFAIFSEPDKNMEPSFKLDKTIRYVLSLLSGIAIAIVLMFYINNFSAEYLYNKSLISASENNVQKTYENLSKAVQKAPKIDRYRITLAQVGYAIASDKAQKLESVTDEEEKKNEIIAITQLLGQAVEQIKAATSLSRYKTTNWETMGQIYQSMIPLAQGATDFAISSYSQAIRLDPINPNLRIALGGIYYSQKDYETAIEVFKLAVLAKPDLANAHYNLAVAYKENKELAKAKDEINTTLLLLGKETADYDVALKELQKIEELSKPTDKIEPIIEPQIELNQ